MPVHHLAAVLFGQGGHALVQNVAQERFRLQHPHAQAVFVAGNLARNFQVEPAVVLDGVGRHDERAQRHVGLALGHPAQRLVFRMGVKHRQIREIPLDPLRHGGCFGQCNGFSVEPGDVGNEGVLLAGNEHVGVDQQGLGEDEPAVAVGCAVEKTHGQALARLGGGHAFFPCGGGMQHKLRPRAGTHQLQQVCGHASVLPALVNHLKRPPIGINTQPDGVLDRQVGTLAVGERDHGRGRSGVTQTGHQQTGQRAQNPSISWFWQCLHQIVGIFGSRQFFHHQNPLHPERPAGAA